MEDFMDSTLKKVGKLMLDSSMMVKNGCRIKDQR